MVAADSLSIDRLIQLGMPKDQAVELHRDLNACSTIHPASRRWERISREVLRPSHPATVHEAAFLATYGDWQTPEGPAPAWFPSANLASTRNLGRILGDLGFESEDAFHRWSVDDRPGFWGMVTNRLGIVFDVPARSVLDLSAGPEKPEWFPGASLNITRSCFRADPGAVAVREEGENGRVRELTYGELNELAASVAAGLVESGLQPGDAVGVLMPMTVEAVASILGILRAGCVVVGVAESFAPPEIALRLQLGRARLVITQDVLHRRGVTYSLLEKLEAVGGIPAVVFRIGEDELELRPGDRRWEEFVRPGSESPLVGSKPSTHIDILFSSGTTGDPKAIPWTQTTAIKAAADGLLYHDIGPGDVVAWPSSPGWMMGPWLIFATLINRGTIALFDGHPGTGEFCRFVESAGVTVLGLVPSLVAAWRSGGWPERHDWSRIKLFSSTGECSNPGDMLYLMARAGYRPIIEYCGGTEIGGGYITSSPLRPNAPACFNQVAHGLELTIRDEEGRPADRGEAFLIGPSLGLSTELLNRDHHETYHAGTPAPEEPGQAPTRRHGDQLERLPGGFFRVLGRVDDTMNLGGIKVSAVELERLINRHPDVAESAAVATRHEGDAIDRLVAFVVPTRSGIEPEPLRTELQALISRLLNPLFRLESVVIVDTLPRTASNKMMRRILRDDASRSGSSSPGPAT